MTGKSEDELVVAEDQLQRLNARQRMIYNAVLSRFSTYLIEEGKNPVKGLGYAENSVPIRLSRFHRAVKYIWDIEEVMTDFTTEHADTVVSDLNADEFRQENGERYSESTKRKFNDVLKNWFQFRNVDWEPDITFTDIPSPHHADPFTKTELVDLWQTTLEYKTIPSYNNLTPENRDRWKCHIAQELGKPKEDVVPADWDTLNRDWTVPSLIRTAREAGWRPDLIGRLSVDWYNQETRTVEIPAGESPKNDAPWNVELSEEAGFALEKFVDQRDTMEKYDGRTVLWLNREGNPYDSGSLNNLLANLIEEAGIKPRNRKLVWYSFRHSIGTYVYEEFKDLEIVAERLRQKSTDSASRYVHKPPEMCREAANIM